MEAKHARQGVGDARARPSRAPVAADLPTFCTPREVADLLRIPVRSVYSLADRQIIRATRVGRLLRFSVEDIQAFIEQASEPWS